MIRCLWRLRGQLIKGVSRDIPVLLVEHDIDRVFALADTVTVMNDGEVLIDGSVDDARNSPRVQEVYIGAGSHALASVERASAARDQVLLAARTSTASPLVMPPSMPPALFVLR